MAHLPQGYRKSDEFMKEDFRAGARLPPTAGIIVRIGRCDHTEFRTLRKDTLADIFRTPRMGTRSDEQNPFPSVRREKLTEGDAFLTRVIRMMSERNNGARRNAMRGQVMRFQFRNARIRT